MRFATIAFEEGTSAAVLHDETHATRVEGFGDVAALLAAGAAGLERARAAADGGFSLIKREQILRPVLAPGATICVGLNYRAHIAEMGREPAKHPTLFAKVARALADPFADVELPKVSTQFDYEGELVVVIGKAGRNISLAEAAEYVGGYTLMNDVSARDFQYRTLQWFAGKNFERSTPVGPYVVTPDEVGELGKRELLVTVNGEIRQRASLADLQFGPADLISEISRLFTLQPGDLIATGTPGGVGYAMAPPQFLADGDVAEISVSGLGTLTTRFRDQRC